MGVSRRKVFLAAWSARAALAALPVPCAAAAAPVAAETCATAQRLAFDVADGPNLNSFLQAGPVAAHLVLRAGTEPRLVIAFPAGDSGVGMWFSATRTPVTWRLDERPQPITRDDEKGRPLHGIETRLTAVTPGLSISRVLLSSVRVLRDYETLGSIPPQVMVAPVAQDRMLTWSRDRLDGAAGYRLSLEVTHGQLAGARVVAGRDGRIGLKVTALTGDPPLTPLCAAALFDAAAPADRAARNVLSFLSYQEKFLAGSWRYDTYFGRDTLMSIRLLMPALAPDAVQDGLGSVLTRLSATGEVAHEEEIGEFALLDHLRAGGDPSAAAPSAAPIFDYKMVDGSFMLAPVAAAWLLENPRAASRAAAFLARMDGAEGRAPRTFGADLVANLRFDLQSAAGFAADPQAGHLVSLKAGFIWGQWRDSDDGLAHGRYPYDVNAVFVPAALAAAARFFDSGLLDPYLSADDRAALSRAAGMAEIWRAKAADLFRVEAPNDTARARIDAYAKSVGVSPDAALRSIGSQPMQFHALALDADARPIPIINSDEGFELLFGQPDLQSLDMAVAAVMRPFPAGLFTEVGVVVANPVFATPALQASFGRNAYHGTVIWSWQQAVLAAGLARQLERRDLPDSLRQRLRVAQRQLWRAIEAGASVINSELWTWSYAHGHYAIAPFGADRSDPNESNAAQLWSTVYLAVHPPESASPRQAAAAGSR